MELLILASSANLDTIIQPYINIIDMNNEMYNPKHGSLEDTTSIR